MEVVKAGNAHVQSALSAGELKVERLAAPANELIDFGELAKRSLGPQWGKLNSKQQEALVATLKDTLRASLSGDMMNEKGVESRQDWGQETIDGNEAKVTSTLFALNEKVSLEYRLYRADEAKPWRVYDVVTDDISLVEAYSDQFKKVMAQKGFDGLLKALKTRQAQLKARLERHS